MGRRPLPPTTLGPTGGRRNRHGNEGRAMGRVTGKVAVISGAARGQGRFRMHGCWRPKARTSSRWICARTSRPMSTRWPGPRTGRDGATGREGGAARVHRNCRRARPACAVNGDRRGRRRIGAPGCRRRQCRHLPAHRRAARPSLADAVDVDLLGVLISLFFSFFFLFRLKFFFFIFFFSGIYLNYARVIIRS